MPWDEADYKVENRLWSEGFRRVMGLDEVGRGCLAGPVVAAGVILDPAKPVSGITDSKSITAGRRTVLAGEIRKHALFCTIAFSDHKEIDSLNILKASLLAMSRCVDQCHPPPDFLLIDGNKGLDGLMIRSETIIGGDRKSASIGAASILAKVWRDEWMARLHKEYPEYGWDRNAGYPTVAHYKALTDHGFSPHHRRSFRLRTERLNSRPVNGPITDR